MKIKRIEFYPVEMKLSEPYTIAYESIDHTTNVYLRLETDSGITGFGCAAPDLAVTRETSESVQKYIDGRAREVLKGTDSLRIAWIMEQLRGDISSDPSALAAIDMALYDILGKNCKMPLWKLLGGFRDHIQTSITIGIMSSAKTVTRAREFVRDGYHCLKIKGGTDVEADIETILQVRKAVGQKVELRFDANQGYTVDQAIHFVSGTISAKIELMEQPTPSGKPDLLGSVTREVTVPVMADESLMNIRDAFRLAQRELVDMVNIKLMKVGGINQAMHINSIARAAGLEVMVGCMDESALAIAAGLHFALSRPNVVYADLDGHLDLIDDPAQGQILIKDGYMYPSDKPGLGIDI